MVEILWHRLETRRQTEKTNVNLYIGRDRSTRLKQTPVIPEEKNNELRCEVSFVFGNFEFPENVAFAFPRKVASTGSEQFEMARTFLVETAEYVTTNVNQYAQAVVLRKSVNIRQVGLVLHNFGGDGWLWVDIFRDDRGKPGSPISTSDFIGLDQLSTKPGYRRPEGVVKGDKAQGI